MTDTGAKRLTTRRALLAGVSGTALSVALMRSNAVRNLSRISAASSVSVAATTTIIQDFVRNIGGDAVTVAGILTPNADPHDYEPTVADADVISKAKVILVHGLGLDAWINKTIQNANTQAPVIVVTDGITPLMGDGSETEGDPHVWFDPTLATTMVTNITTGLAAADPANADTYRQNAAAYTARITAMDGQVSAIYRGIPRAQRKLVTNHDAFRYLARRYDLSIVGAVIPALSDAAEPSAKQVNDLIDTITREGVRAIFAESQANPTVARQVAQATGVTIVDNLYADTLGEPGSDGDTYLKMMVADATLIANALT